MSVSIAREDLLLAVAQLLDAGADAAAPSRAAPTVWNRWFCDDVAQRADLLVELAAALHAEVLGHRDLHLSARSCGSRSARGTSWRTGSRGGSGSPPCRGSGRSGRWPARGTPSGATSVELPRRREVAPERLLDDHARVLRRSPTSRAPRPPSRTCSAGSRGSAPDARAVARGLLRAP